MFYLIKAEITRIARGGGIINGKVTPFHLSASDHQIRDAKQAASVAYSLIEGINPNCGIVVTATYSAHIMEDVKPTTSFTMTAANRE